jgi:cobalt/nickel transport system permease protein
MTIGFGEYTEGSSLIHRLDTRIKLVGAFATIISVVLLGHWQMPLVVLFVCFVLVVYSRASSKIFLKRLLYPTLVIVLLAVVQPFTYGSIVAATVPWLSWNIYQEGISFGVLVFTRALSAVAVLNLLILVTPMERVLDSLRWFKIPAAITDTMMLMFRYISVLSEESTRIRKAQESRLGYSKDVSVVKKLGNFGTMAGMLLTKSFDRALTVGDAMVSRGYTGASDLFAGSTTKLSPKDSLIGLLIILAVVSLVIVDIFVL